MAPEVKSIEAATAAATSFSRKRKLKHGGKGKKKPNKQLKPVAKTKNPSQKMMKLFKKRAKAYNSDESEEDEEYMDNADEQSSDEEEQEEEQEKEEEERDFDASDDEEEDDGSRLGVTKFAEGCRGFRTAFLKIMKKHLPNDPLGPILSAHKKLIADKLLEEETEHKAKGQAKKEKHLAGEKGHIKPASFLDTKEKLLISIATKGVVKLFNAVNKAQNPQKDLNPSRSKDAKELAKRRKQTFLSEINKSASEKSDNSFYSSKVKSASKENDDEPRWAPLRDGYILNNSKLKDWDKMPEPAAVDDQGTASLESSDED